ncbi:MAG: hypothetical protein Q6K18_04625, partial [Gloeomargarita sp. DG_1_5_bins_55]
SNRLTGLESQTQNQQLSQDTLTQLVTSLQSLNEGIVNLPRTDTVLERLTTLEQKMATPATPNLALWIGAVAVGAFVGAAIGASVVAGQRQSQSLRPLPSSVCAATISVHSG